MVNSLKSEIEHLNNKNNFKKNNNNKNVNTNLNKNNSKDKYCLAFNRTNYREVIRLQIYLAENNIPFTYTDTISISELEYLFKILNEYLKEKNDSLEKVQE